MDERQTQEYAVLRHTIRSRGTLRVVLVLAGLSVWALVLVAVLTWLPTPVAGTVPLLLLVATFEANRTLLVGVERIGRYVQVFYEETARVSDAHAPIAPPAWERTALLFGPQMPGTGGHPLFLPLFLLACLINFLSVMLPGPVAVELGAMSVPHIAFIAWMIYADRGMRAQRAAELARYRELRDRGVPSSE